MGLITDIGLKARKTAIKRILSHLNVHSGIENQLVVSEEDGGKVIELFMY
jgi:hypothetical protein